ncbi:hypothetical protein SprV_0702357500 [Sparganum proliferum]
MSALPMRILCVRFGLVGHLRTQCANYPTTPTFLHTNTAIITPVENLATTTTPVTSDQTTDIPQPSVSDTIYPTPNPASITATYCGNTTTFCTPPPMGREPMSRYLPSSSTPLPQAMWTRSQRVLTVIANSPHTSAWSVAGEAIAQRLANQRLKHQYTPDALDSTARKAY